LRTGAVSDHTVDTIARDWKAAPGVASRLHRQSAIRNPQFSPPMPRSLCGLAKPDLVAWLSSVNEPAWRADQVRRWVFSGRADSSAEMLDLPVTLRGRLAEEFSLFSGREVECRVARDRTEKLLVEWPDGHRVECVLMREPGRSTICLSTQVGCGMGCVFCASGLLGLERNLSSGEILEQVLRLNRRMEPGERLTNVVVMGIGEPLANLDALLPALEELHADDGLGLSPRRVTISTVGLPAGIRRLAALARPYNLAVSLHATNDELRNELVPVNDRIGLAEILEAADEYFAVTGRRITYEYVLLADTNDQPGHARQLAALLAGRNAHVNLIPMNPVVGLPWQAPGRTPMRQFVEILEQHGIATTVRKRKGADIDAACGQLRLAAAETG